MKREPGNAQDSLRKKERNETTGDCLEGKRGRARMQRVVIVGATDGIGRELAFVYAARGFWVALIGRNASKLSALVAEFSKKFPDATVKGVVCDVLDASRIEPAFKEAIAAIGHCDLFIYVAGVMLETDGVTSVPDEDAETFEVNTVAAARMLGLAANYFR